MVIEGVFGFYFIITLWIVAILPVLPISQCTYFEKELITQNRKLLLL
jgi:predicted secreted protein